MNSRLRFVCLVGLLLLCRSAFGQEVGAAFAVDSLHVSERSVDSLSHLDSLLWSQIKRQDDRLLSLKQVASQRSIDLTNDGKPELLRVSGAITKGIDGSLLTLTIKRGKKIIYTDTWKAGAYFDTIDHLSDTAKLRRLHRYVTIGFANENFTVLDSNEYTRILQDRNPGDVAPDSPEIRELLSQPRVMYNVFAGLDRMYGIAWLPNENRFVKVWQN